MNANFSSRLRTLRKDMGYTQSDLAKLLNIGQTTIANYESGHRTPDISKIKEIANLFNVSIDYILGMNDIKIANNDIYKYDDYLQALLIGNKNKALEIALSFFQNGIELKVFYKDIIEKSLVKIGELWEIGKVDVWKEHLATEISKVVLDNYKMNFSPTTPNNKKIIAFTPGAETHSMGLKIVSDFLEQQGYNILFLGTNIPNRSIINAIRDEDPYAICLSVTMRYHIESAKNIISSIKNTFKKQSPLIIIGGFALNEQYDVIGLTGADYYIKNLDDLARI